MSEPMIKLEKRLLSYNIWLKMDEAGSSLLENARANKPSITERVLNFIEDMRSHVIDVNLPDPLRLVTEDGNSGWRYGDSTQMSDPNYVAGYVFIENQPDVSDSVRSNLILLRHALDFLLHDDAGNAEAAYDSLFEFAQSYTLLWAEVEAKPDMERGQATSQAASQGGKNKATSYVERNHSIVQRMKTLKDDGHTLKRAAQLAAKQGYGTSWGANLKVWERHGK